MVGELKSPCIKVKYVSVKNPVYGKYTKERNEPKHTHLHRLAFIIQNKYAPKKVSMLVINHMCHGNSYKRKSKHINTVCLNVDHMKMENTKINISRNACLKKLLKLERSWRKKPNKTLKRTRLHLACCPKKHNPSCYLSVGQWK